MYIHMELSFVYVENNLCIISLCGNTLFKLMCNHLSSIHLILLWMYNRTRVCMIVYINYDFLFFD